MKEPKVELQKTWILTEKAENGFKGIQLKKPLSSYSKQALCDYINKLLIRKFVIINTNLSELGIKIENGRAIYSTLRFASKGNDPNKSFWVEKYNDEERDFFIKLGFTETIDKTPKEFQEKPHGNTLNFHGSGVFGYWDKKEAKHIYNEVKKHFNLKNVPIYKYQLHELL